MKKILVGLCVLACLAMSASVVRAEDMDKPAAAAGKTMTCYTCDKCHTLSMQAGKCAMCGAEMTQTHVVAIKDGNAYCCSCEAGCKCEMKGDDMTKCSCGKDMKKVPMKGMYTCGCGADCKCNTMSDKPGKCGCGKDMKLVE